MAQAVLGFTANNIRCLSLSQLDGAYDALRAAAEALLSIRNEPRAKIAAANLLEEEEERLERLMESIIRAARAIDPRDINPADWEEAGMRRKLLMKHAVRVDDPDLEHEIVRSFMWDPRWVAGKLRAAGHAVA